MKAMGSRSSAKEILKQYANAERKARIEYIDNISGKAERDACRYYQNQHSGVMSLRRNLRLAILVGILLTVAATTVIGVANDGGINVQGLDIREGAGELIISYNAGIMYHKIIHLLAKINSVSPVPYEKKSYGKYMAVPFGKLLEGSAVPNTVTKSLHTEKYFNRDVTGFSIEESGFYSTIEDQIRTIKSFDRPVILVDDLLHKGYRMKGIDPVLKDIGVEVIDTVVGVQTGRGRDLMTIKERTVDSAYFLPNLKCWLDESDMYPYIGGDSIKEEGIPVADHDFISSLNLILPFAVPTFLGDIPGESFYDFSMTCLENAESILKTLEEEYQKVFERKLTLKRLGEVITDPKNPDMFAHVKLDESMAPSAFVEMDIEKLIRMRKMFR